MGAAAPSPSRCIRAIPATQRPFLPQVRKLRENFGPEQMVIVGDRGMISQASIEQLREEHFSWITALKSAQNRSA
jgi:transposase